MSGMRSGSAPIQSESARLLAPGSSPGYRIRRVSAIDDLESISSLQASIWGSVEVAAPASLLKAMAAAGGITLLAEAAGQPVGFAYGFTGRTPAGVLYHRSHAAGVLAGVRDAGVGRGLKLAQRRHALAQGLNRMVWTFEPSQMRNAHFNLHRLGGVARAFHRDYYGRRLDALNTLGPTDRLVVEWFLAKEEPRALASLRQHPVASVQVPEAVAQPSPQGDAARRALRRDLERAFAGGLTAVDYNSQTRSYWFAELPSSFPARAE
ncbi:MAG TPA: hypothetical protein VMV23_06690 [Candidatus Nanopelagicaceae bacterium]|nr:hypothetical protein [Candidatus Nanopelagicaceae bacterium]